MSSSWSPCGCSSAKPSSPTGRTRTGSRRGSTAPARSSAPGLCASTRGVSASLDRLSPGCEHTFVSDEAVILHADADAFFASVEQRDDPRLRGRPVVVGGGVVMAASYEARAFGIHGGMGGGRARRLCPHVAVVQPRFSAYVEASKALFALFEEMSPLVEGL